MSEPRRLSLYELRQQRVAERKNVPREEWEDKLPHASECECPCHNPYRTVDDDHCDGTPFVPASEPAITTCCYVGPRRPSCEGCGKSTWALAPLEGLKLCRGCRRVVR